VWEGGWAGLAGSTAELLNFGHAIEASLAVNLGYSLLLNFGKFSGKTIDTWMDQEKVRLTVALAENQTFNKTLLDERANLVRTLWTSVISFSNWLAIAWAILAACAAVALLVVMGFRPALPLPGDCAMEGALFLFGPVPIGLFFCLIFHGSARVHMHLMTREWNSALRYFTKEPRQKIAEARQALKTHPKPPRRKAEGRPEAGTLNERPTPSAEE